MPRFLSRYWLALVALAALAVIAYAIVRPLPGFSQAATAKDTAPGSLNSVSGPNDWAMEGYDPGRTRAVAATIDLPLNSYRELNIQQMGQNGSPVAIGKNIMLVEAENRLRAISLRSGKELWSFAATGTYISPAIADRTVYIRAEAANKGQVFALDLATGKQLWAFTPKRLASSATSYWGGHLTSPVVSDGLVYIGGGKELYALDAASGETRWEYSGTDYVASSATVGNGRVFISNATTILALDQHTGTLIWKQPITFAIYFAPVVAGDTVYLTTGDNILALDTATGAKRWEKGIAQESLRPGAVQGKHIFVKSTSTLYALDTATGQEVWHFSSPAFVSFPVTAGSKLFTISGAPGQTAVSVLDTATGKQLDNQRLPKLANAAPIIAGKTVYARTTDGRVIGLSH
jgi:outer membrane protein assembly factor BamB